jgi:hypothetical protein
VHKDRTRHSLLPTAVSARAHPHAHTPVQTLCRTCRAPAGLDRAIFACASRHVRLAPSLRTTLKDRVLVESASPRVGAGPVPPSPQMGGAPPAFPRDADLTQRAIGHKRQAARRRPATRRPTQHQGSYAVGPQHHERPKASASVPSGAPACHPVLPQHACWCPARAPRSDPSRDPIRSAQGVPRGSTWAVHVVSRRRPRGKSSLDPSARPGPRHAEVGASGPCSHERSQCACPCSARREAAP